MRETIYTENAPKPIGPYSQGVRVGNTWYFSGQIAINPETNSMEMQSIEEETKRVMENISALLKASGLGFEHVVKSSIFLKDMGHFQRVNEIYGSYFTQNAPARETVEVARLPKDARVEISIIAYKE